MAIKTVKCKKKKYTWERLKEVCAKIEIMCWGKSEITIIMFLYL
jgi:hypothetical protein